MSRFKTGDKVRAKNDTKLYKALGCRADEVGTVKIFGCGGLYVHFEDYLAVPLKNVEEQLEYVQKI